MSPFFLIPFLLLAPAPRQLGGVPSAQSRILEAAVEMLSTRYPAEVHRLQVQVLRSGGGIDKTQPLRLRMPAVVNLPRAHFQVKVHQRQDGDWQEAGWAMLYIAHFDSVAMLSRRYQRDEVIDVADLNYTWIETTRFSGEPLTPVLVNQLRNRGKMIADRFLSQDRSLRAGDVRNPYDITLGQSVTMTYRRNHIVLEFTCKARKRGFKGDEIKLFAHSTNKTYRARISGPGTADWLETLD